MDLKVFPWQPDISGTCHPTATSIKRRIQRVSQIVSSKRLLIEALDSLERKDGNQSKGICRSRTTKGLKNHRQHPRALLTQTLTTLVPPSLHNSIMIPRTKPEIHRRKRFTGRRHRRVHKRSSDLASSPNATGSRNSSLISRSKPPRSKAPSKPGILPDSEDPLEENIFERAAMPEGYVFVPKGDVYITRHCRTNTKTSNRLVYLVYDKAAKRTLGIRVPEEIYTNVSKLATSTAEKRASAVKVRDGTFITRGRKLLRNVFPLMPNETLEIILNHAFLKGSGRVGRTSTTTDKRKATLAVEAHIRHNHTPYERLLASGLERCEARERVWPEVKAIKKAWEGSEEAKKIEMVLRPAHTDDDDACVVVSDDDDDACVVVSDDDIDNVVVLD